MLSHHEIRRAVAVAAVLQAVAVSCAHTGGKAGSAPDAKAMLAWEFARVGGGKLMLGELPARVKVATFFATWAPSCIYQMEALGEVFRRTSSRGFMAVGVGMDIEGELTLAPFAGQFKVPFPLAIAGDAVLRGASPFGRITTVPMSFIFGPDDRLLYIFAGVIPDKRLDEVLDRHLR